MAGGSTLGDAYVNILGNLNPLSSAFAQGQMMAQSFTSNIGSTLTRGIAVFVGPFIAAMSIENVMKEWMGKEVVINKLATALKASGDNVDYLLPRFQAFAEEMQNTTVNSHEAVMASMAHAKSLGIEANQIEAITRAAIGLGAKIGKDMGAAMQLLIRASHGSTQRLKMYGIELDQTASKQEKFQQLLKIGADSFSLAAGQAQTLQGRLTILKNMWGDVLGSLGQGISGEMLGNALDKMKTSMSAWQEMVNRWNEEGTTAGVTGAMLNIVNSLVAGFRYLFAFIRIGVGAIADLWETYLQRPMLAVIETLTLAWAKMFQGSKQEWGDIFKTVNRHRTEDKTWGETYANKGVQDVKDIYKSQLSWEDTILGSADKKGKTPFSPKSPVQKAVEGKAGEVFSFAEAWSRLQKEAVKSDKEDEAMGLQRDANDKLAQLVTNTTPPAASPMPPPTNPNPAYDPGQIEAVVAGIKENTDFWSKHRLGKA